MKALLKVTVLVSIQLLLSGCYKKRYYGLLDESKKAKIENVQKLKVAFNNGRSQGIREGVLVGREEGRLATQQEFITKQAELISLSTEYFKRNFNFPTARGNEMFEAFLALEQRGDSRALDQFILYIGNEFIRLVDQQHPLENRKKQEVRRLLQVSYHDISSKIRNDYLNSPRFVSGSSKTFIRSTEYSMRADLIGRIIASNICSYSTKIFNPLNIVLDFPVNIIAGKIMQSPCEALLNSMANVIGEEISRAGLIKDIVTTSTTIRTTEKLNLAELSTASIAFSIQRDIRYQRRFLIAIWTSATVNCNYKVTVKAGFDFDKSFNVEINNVDRKIYIRVPTARITNTILEPKVCLIDDGGITDVDPNITKQIFDSMKAQAIEHAVANNLFKTANANAKNILSAIYGPIAENPLCPYKIVYITGGK